MKISLCKFCNNALNGKNIRIMDKQGGKKVIMVKMPDPNLSLGEIDGMMKIQDNTAKYSGLFNKSLKGKLSV